MLGEDLMEGAWFWKAPIPIPEELNCEDGPLVASTAPPSVQSFHTRARSRDGSHSSIRTSGSSPVNGSTGGAFPWRALGTGSSLAWGSSTNRVSSHV